MKRMKLTFIGSFVKAKTGIERVNLELIKHLLQDEEIEKIDIITSRSRAQIPDDLLKNNKLEVHIFPDSLIKAPVFLHKFLSAVYKNPICVIANIRPWAVLTYLFYPLFKRKVKIIQFVPDIIAWHYPELFPNIISLAFKIYGHFFANYPSLYIVHSDFTKNDIVKSWGVPSEKIKIVKLGSFIEPMTPRENFQGKKILYVGTIEPRKGVDKLLDVFEIVQREISDAQLILCGKIGWKVDKLVERIKKLTEQNENVKYLGYVDDDELIKLFRDVDVCVYPSLYEGFGLPPLEAMSCGCPVIVSNTSSLPEVVGEAGILIDPRDTNALANAIIKVLTDKNLKISLSKIGVERAKILNLEIQMKEIVKTIKSSRN